MEFNPKRHNNQNWKIPTSKMENGYELKNLTLLQLVRRQSTWKGRKIPNVLWDQHHQSTEREGFLLPLPGGSSSLTEHQGFQTFIFKDLARDDSWVQGRKAAEIYLSMLANKSSLFSALWGDYKHQNQPKISISDYSWINANCSKTFWYFPSN